MMTDRGNFVSQDFTVKDLSRIRGLVTRAAHAIGLAVARIEDFVVAVNEIVVNAIQHAGGHGRITLRWGPAGLFVEVSDHGPGLPAGCAIRRAPSDAAGGRGLWLAERLCSRMTFKSTSSGLTVGLEALRS